MNQLMNRRKESIGGGKKKNHFYTIKTNTKTGNYEKASLMSHQKQVT